MDELALESLAERVERLEQQNRRLKLAVLAGLVLVAAMMWIGAAARPKVVEAQGFVLRDAQGKERARLMAPRELDERTSLLLLDTKGQEQAALLGDLGGAELRLWSPKRDLEVLAQAHWDSGHLRIQGNNGAPSLLLTSAKPAAALEAFDAKGKRRAYLSVTPNESCFSLSDWGERQAQAELSVGCDGADPVLRLEDAEGKTMRVRASQEKGAGE